MNTVPSIETPSYLNLSISNGPAEPSLAITAVWESKMLKYTAGKVTLEHPMIPITAGLLRKLPLRRLMAAALTKELATANEALNHRAPIKTFFKGSQGRPASAKIAAEPTTEHLVNTALVFQLAHATGVAPIRSVERCLGIEYKDAQRWVRLARQGNILSL